MRNSALVLLVCFACVCIGDSLAEDSDRGSRGLLKRGLLAKAKVVITTKPPPAPAAEEDYAEEGEYEGGDWERGVAERGAEEAEVTEAPAVTTTESKRLGGVRPFRSNTELLEALKRKRAQQAQAKHEQGGNGNTPAQSQDEPTEVPVKASAFSKKRFSSGLRETAAEDSAAPAPTPAKPQRNRFGRPSGKSAAAPAAAETEEEPAPASTGSRAGRTFARRN